MNRVLAGQAITPGVSPYSEFVRLSKWVNEPYPPWAEILTAHDVARLTRRHRWMLSALVAVGCFPQKRRFRGRAVGWHRCDVERWVRQAQPGSPSRNREARGPVAATLPMPIGIATPDGRTHGNQ